MPMAAVFGQVNINSMQAASSRLVGPSGAVRLCPRTSSGARTSMSTWMYIRSARRLSLSICVCTLGVMPRMSSVERISTFRRLMSSISRGSVSLTSARRIQLGGRGGSNPAASRLFGLKRPAARDTSIPPYIPLNVVSGVLMSACASKYTRAILWGT
jgi:hypothetical protein